MESLHNPCKTKNGIFTKKGEDRECQNETDKDPVTGQPFGTTCCRKDRDLTVTPIRAPTGSRLINLTIPGLSTTISIDVLELVRRLEMQKNCLLEVMHDEKPYKFNLTKFQLEEISAAYAAATGLCAQFVCK